MHWVVGQRMRARLRAPAEILVTANENSVSRGSGRTIDPAGAGDHALARPARRARAFNRSPDVLPPHRCHRAHSSRRPRRRARTGNRSRAARCLGCHTRGADSGLSQNLRRLGLSKISRYRARAMGAEAPEGIPRYAVTEPQCL